MEWTLTERHPANPDALVALQLALTAEERRRSRLQATTPDGQTVKLQLPRGTVLLNGDLLTADGTTDRVRIVAGPEPVLTVRADNPHNLLKAAYHLGNRHIALEVGHDYLRLTPDPVLAHMLEHLGVTVVAETTPFEPEVGAYQHEHSL
ncbi:MAG: urease accessory protein UreE [Candidatus Sericytochromatia bacterium]|nr:urease accessory protein UreE [Candidatus Sericytochromatia bacterium]